MPYGKLGPVSNGPSEPSIVIKEPAELMDTRCCSPVDCDPVPRPWPPLRASVDVTSRRYDGFAVLFREANRRKSVSEPFVRGIDGGGGGDDD